MTKKEQGDLSLQPQINGEGQKPQPEPVVEMIDEAAPYREMDLRDEQIIVASYEGLDIGSMIYNIPFKGKGITDCGIPECPYDGKFQHTHVCGISIKGVLELRRHCGGITSGPVPGSTILTKQNGVEGYFTRACAIDYFTMTTQFTEIFQPSVRWNKQYNEWKKIDFADVIARSKAVRNAIETLIPRPVIEGIAKLGLEGKEYFDAADIKRLFKPFWLERELKKKRFFDALTAGKIQMDSSMFMEQSPGGGLLGIGSAPPPAAKQKKQPEANTKKTNNPPSENGNNNSYPDLSHKKMSSAQIGMIKGLLKEQPKSDRDAFIENCATNMQEASDIITAFKDGRYDAFFNFIKEGWKR